MFNSIGDMFTYKEFKLTKVMQVTGVNKANPLCLNDLKIEAFHQLHYSQPSSKIALRY